MSKLLINEPPLEVQPSLARIIGLNEAIILQQIHYWANKPGIGKEHKGRKWVYNSIPQWQKTNFPFWSEGTIKRTLASLKKQKLVAAKNLNKKKYDRTLWYAINYDRLDELERGDPIIGSNCTDGEDQSDPIDQAKMITPLPETTTETTTEIKDYAANAAQEQKICHVEGCGHKATQKGKDGNDYCGFCILRLVWAVLFPGKSQPQLSTESYRKDVDRSFKSSYFQEHWRDAWLRASKSDFLNEGNFFQFDWILNTAKTVKNGDKNIRKILQGNYDNGKYTGRGNGHTNGRSSSITSPTEMDWDAVPGGADTRFVTADNYQEGWEPA
jgi:hypothetical protein